MTDSTLASDPAQGSVISNGKEVITMEYRKPEMILVVNAADVIQSSLDKDAIPVDHATNTGLTGTAAYESDE